jgi:hypothetical protein
MSHYHGNLKVFELDHEFVNEDPKYEDSYHKSQ